MELDFINELLKDDGNTIIINNNLTKVIGIEASILYSFLVAKKTFLNKAKIKELIKDNNFFHCSVEEIEESTTLSAFKQRNAINVLVDKQLIQVKFGHARTRLFLINEDPRPLQLLLYLHKEKNNEYYSTLKDDFFIYITKQVKLFEHINKARIKENLYNDVLKYVNLLTLSNNINNKIDNIQLTDKNDNEKETVKILNIITKEYLKK